MAKLYTHILFLHKSSNATQTAIKKLASGGYTVKSVLTTDEAAEQLHLLPRPVLFLAELDREHRFQPIAISTLAQVHSVPYLYWSAMDEGETVNRTTDNPGSGFVLQSEPLEALTAAVRIALACQCSPRDTGQNTELQTILQNLEMVFFKISPSGIFLVSEGKGLEKLGLHNGEVEGKSILDVYKDFPDILEGAKRALKGEKLRQVISVASVFFEVVYTPVFDCAGNLVSVTGVAIDITDRLAAEAALVESEEKHRFLFEHMTQGVVFHNASGEVIYANDSASRILGLSLDQLYGLTALDPRWKSIHEDGSDYPGETHPAMITLRTGKVVRNAVMGVFNPQIDQYNWIRINAHPRFNPVDNRLIQAIVTIEDITAVKRAEDALKTELQEKEVLLRETHHRIKNNIASIAGLLTIQAAGTESTEAKHILQEAVSRVYSMQKLYEKMLVSGEYRKIDSAPFLQDLAQNVAELFASMTHITLHTDLQSIILSSRQIFPLGIILNELMTNAFKYAFEGRLTGKLYITTSHKNGTVRLQITDDGCGLPDNFDQVSSGSFGLTLVQMLAQQLKGTFSITSQEGTQAVVEFPDYDCSE